MTDLDSIISEIAGQLEPLENALATGLGAYIRQDGGSWSSYERSAAFEDMRELSRGKDCTYDRPSIGASYAAWFHPSRIEDMVRLLTRPVAESRDSIDIVDVGCGTGATAWALAVIVQALADSGHQPKEVRITASDSSPFMVETARVLWTALEEEQAFATASDLIDVEWSVAHIPPRRGLSFPWLVAGYMIDHSDVTQPGEVARAIAHIAEEHGAYRMYLTTSERKASSVLPRADRALSDEGWSENGAAELGSIWKGQAAHLVLPVRSELYAGTSVSGVAVKAPSWSSPWTAFRSYARNVDDRGQSGSFGAEVDDGPLDGAQRKARDGSVADNPEAIIGAAGSGKSIVLAHRVARTIDEALRSRQEQRILVTCFNKEMVRTLVEMWQNTMPAHVDVERVGKWKEDEYSDQAFAISEGETTVRCRFVNLDKVPTRILGLEFPSAPSTGAEIPGAFLTKRDLSGEDQVRFGRYLEPAFLLDEINNVVAGQGAVDWETYSQVQRRGRPFSNLKKGGPERRIIWKAINRHPTGAFPFRWWTLIESNLNRLANETPLVAEPFDYVFVDEAQDFTEYQLRFIGGLAVRPSRLVVAIDQAQSIRIGPSFSRPKFRTRWANRHELKGSYRLPVRVAEAARPLADSISKRHGSTGRRPDTVSPVSRKAAVLGFRPIVIHGDHPEDLDEVLRTYLGRVPDELAGTITVAQERGGRNGLGLRIEALVSDDWNVRGEWVESIKGQERSVVVWRSGALRGDPIGMAETIYTIATRTTSLLILQLDNETPPATQAVIGRLERGRLLFWSPDARKQYDRFAALVGGDDDPLADTDIASAEPGSVRPPYEIFSVDESASAGVPIGEDGAARVGRQSVWQEGDVVFVSEGKGATPQGFRAGVFDEAFTAWVGSGMSMDPKELGRVDDPARLRTLLRLFNKGTVGDGVESTEVASV